MLRGTHAPQGRTILPSWLRLHLPAPMDVATALQSEMKWPEVRQKVQALLPDVLVAGATAPTLCGSAPVRCVCRVAVTAVTGGNH
jgi:hypothetical protein